MFLKDVRQYVTEQLDTTVKVLRKYRDNSGFIVIKEKAGREDEDRKEVVGSLLLNEVKILNIPQTDVWIFENEFDKNTDTHLKTLKDAFTSAGKKVEKTIICHRDNNLYVFMIEMKRSISPRKYKEDVTKKYEGSLATLSVFISASEHFDDSLLKKAKLYPIGVCCYNYYEDTQPSFDRDQKSIAGSFRQKYEQGTREMLLLVEPLTLNATRIPVIFCENNNKPITNSFEIDFENILSRVSSMLEE